MRRLSFKTIGTLVAILMSALVMLAAGRALARLNQRSREAGLRVAEAAIERAVMQCYALEGSYPPSLDYLAENYGLILNPDRYVYQYEVVSGNIHPVIGVQFPGGSD
jgi:hypothetical protein